MTINIDVTELRRPELVQRGGMWNEVYEVYDNGYVRITTYWDDEEEVHGYKYANVDEAMYELARRYY